MFRLSNIIMALVVGGFLLARGLLGMEGTPEGVFSAGNEEVKVALADQNSYPISTQ